MTSSLFVKLLMGILSICSVLVTVYLLPYIKTKISTEDMKKLLNYAAIAVRCAEQIYTKEQWQEKKEYVMDYCMKIINEKLHIDVTYDELDTIVEGIVNEVKHGIGTLVTEEVGVM